MLRVKIELVPDNQLLERNVKPVLLKIIDIKEDGTGNAFWGNYKTRFYDTERAEQSTIWRQKQVSRMLYKDYYPILLLYLALKNYITDMRQETVSWDTRKWAVKTPVDYPAWKMRRYGTMDDPPANSYTRKRREEETGNPNRTDK